MLSLKGHVLDLTELLNAKKFRTSGNKPGALRAFKLLEQEGLGCLDARPGRGADKVFLSHTLQINVASLRSVGIILYNDYYYSWVIRIYI